MRFLLLSLSSLLLASCVAQLWLWHQLRTSAERWGRRERKWRRRFETIRLRLGGRKAPLPRRCFRGGHNRTASEVEEKLCRLAAERRDLGLRGLRVLLQCVEGVWLGVATVRAILIRRRELLAKLEDSRKKKRRISVARTGALWGLDFTLVWLWGVVPVWLLGVVDYHGSRLLLLAPTLPTAAAAARKLERLFVEQGFPQAVLTDNGGQFRAEAFKGLLEKRGVEHRRIRPGHAWTNGRIERVFGTFKALHRRYARIFVSPAHLRRFCLDFGRYYNSCRPHASYWGFTPDEVARDEAALGPLGIVSLFEGQLLAHRFT